MMHLNPPNTAIRFCIYVDLVLCRKHDLYLVQNKTKQNRTTSLVQFSYVYIELHIWDWFHM